MEDTQYTPWLELGIDELAYYKKRFLETCAELAAWKAEAMAAREFIGVMAKRLGELAHDEELEDESKKVFWQYLAARVKDGE